MLNFLLKIVVSLEVISLWQDIQDTQDKTSTVPVKYHGTVCPGSSDPPEYYSFTEQNNFRSNELYWIK